MQNRSQSESERTTVLVLELVTAQRSYATRLTVRTPFFLVLIDDLEVGCLAHKYVDDTTLTELISDRTMLSNMQTIFEQLLTWADITTN